MTLKNFTIQYIAWWLLIGMIATLALGIDAVRSAVVIGDLNHLEQASK